MVHRQIAIIKVRPGAKQMTFYTHQSWDCVGTSSHNHSLFSSIGHIIIHEIIFVLLPPTNISILARVKINDELVPRQDKRLKSWDEKKKRMKEKSRHWWNSFKNNKAHNSRCGLEKILNGFWNSWNGLWFGLWWLLSMHKMTIKKSKIEQ